MHTTRNSVIMTIVNVGGKLSGHQSCCGLTWGYTPEVGYTFSMWHIPDHGKMISTTLRADVTSEERLMAHWSGFVENYSKGK